MKDSKKNNRREFLSILIDSRGLNQANLASKLNVHPSHISMHLSGQRSLSVERGQILAEYLGIPLEYVYK